MKKTVSSSTAIKAKFSNQVHEVFQTLFTEQERKLSYGSKRWKLQSKVDQMSDKQKAELFGKLFNVYADTSMELGRIRHKKRQKKQLAKERAARGVEPKVKTTKAQWEQMQKQLKTA